MDTEAHSPQKILICVKGSCADPEEGFALEKYVLARLAWHGLDNPAHPRHTTCAVVNCLAACERQGPIMMVNPGAIKYHRLNQAVVDRIIEEHILNNTPVEAHIVRPLQVREQPAGKKPAEKPARY